MVSISSAPVKNARDEGAGKAGDDQQHGVAEDVAVEHLALAAALGARGQHVLLADLVQEAVLGQDGQGGEGADAHGEQRQRQVPEIVEDLAPPRQHAHQSSEVQAAQREQI